MDPFPLGHRAAIRPADHPRAAGRLRPAGALALALLWLGVAPATAAETAHEGTARHEMVAAANPLAAAAGRDILRQGGSAVDAVIATQFVLNLVEPESSGIGGGAFLVHYSARDHKVTTFDGRESAPAAAKPDRFLDAGGKPLAFMNAVVGGRSVGVPGLLRMLALAHRRFGKLPWARLVQPAIALAESGFPMPRRLYEELAADRYLSKTPAARELYYQADGTPKPIGAMIANPALAATLRIIADQGADAFYRGPIADDIVATVDNAPNHPGDLTASDLANYQAKERPPVCGSYRGDRLCGMGPPSSGAITLLEILGLLRPFDMAQQRDTPAAWHLFAEASRLAYADRDRYLADSDFVADPIRGLLDPAYLAARSRLIDPAHALPEPVLPGNPAGRHAANWGDDDAPELPSTSNVAVIDRDGNALDMTTTIENEFGSRLMVRGFLLNNELTDFSFLPEVDGHPVANRVEGGKRPRSAMTPTLVFAPNGKLALVVGSAGGPAITTDVAKSIVAVLDWHDDLQQAFALPNVATRRGALLLDVAPGTKALGAALTAMGHRVQPSTRASGLTGIRITPTGLDGAADPRRDGIALGD